MSSSGVPSRQSSPTTESLRALDLDEPHHAQRDRVGPRRRAQREGAALLAVVPRHLQHEVAPRLVHPVEHDRWLQVSTPCSACAQRGSTSMVQTASDSRGVLRAVLALLPGRADAADEIERGVEVLGQVDGDLAVPDAEGVRRSRWSRRSRRWSCADAVSPAHERGLSPGCIACERLPTAAACTCSA